MNDYISKQAAIDLEPPERYERQYQTMNLDDAYEAGWYDAQGEISQLPPADVRPVVLCGDCAHWDCDTIEMHDRCNNAEEGVDKTQARFAECLKFSSWAKCVMMREDDYCSVGRFAIKGIKDDANSCCGSYNGVDADG